MFVKWYNVYSVLGGFSYYLEWNLFVICFMNMMGYNIDCLVWIRNFDFEGLFFFVIVFKKVRFFEIGFDDDWEYLLNLDYYQNVEFYFLNRFLCLSFLEVLQMKDEDFLQNFSLDFFIFFFIYIFVIFFVFYFVYEEFKLNILMGEGICLFVDFFVQLVRDLKLGFYVDYYYRDYLIFVRIIG